MGDDGVADITLKMTEIMSDMYQTQLDKDNVSVHSAFICLLHLANEKGLSFTQGSDAEREWDFQIQTSN